MAQAPLTRHLCEALQTTSVGVVQDWTVTTDRHHHKEYERVVLFQGTLYTLRHVGWTGIVYWSFTHKQ